MRKLTTILLAGFAVFAFTACGGGGGGSSTPDNGGSTQPPATESKSPYDTVQIVYDGDKIGAGIFKGENINYYDLTMPTKGILLVDAEGVSWNYVTIYDENLNLISEEHEGSIELEAGDYIIKFDHATQKYGPSTYTFTLYSNSLYNLKSIPAIKNGTQSGAYLKYYRINMPTKGILLFDGEGASTNYVTIYDENLNLISEEHEGSIELEAGDYIIKFDHATQKYGPSTYTFTLNSNVW